MSDRSNPPILKANRRAVLTGLGAAAFVPMAPAVLRAQASRQDMYETLRGINEFDILVQLIQAAAIVWRFTGPEQRTLFAPRDIAWNNLPGGFQDMFEPIHQQNLQAILLYHMVSGRVTAESVANGPIEVDSWQMSPVKIESRDGRLHYDGVPVMGQRIETRNGLIYPIDQVLLPLGGRRRRPPEPEQPAG